MNEPQKRIAVLGSTGSIGTQTLDVVRRNADRFRVVALAAGHDSDAFQAQMAEFRPALSATGDAATPEGLAHIAGSPDVDTVVLAIPGLAALAPALAAIKEGKTLAFASKEILVVAGELVMSEVARTGAALLPVDSEHSALWQCLAGEPKEAINRLILTASGGPFYARDDAELESVTPEEALAHPTWRMGPKVTIDSATLMNKALEVIEARWLYDVDYDRIDVMIHRQSINHSMVEFTNGTLKAQLSMPDMRLPIQYALAYPERIERPSDWRELDYSIDHTFEALERGRFPCFWLAVDAARSGKTYPAVLNAADEVAVELFLSGAISFTSIPSLIMIALDAHTPVNRPTLDDLLAADTWARDHVRNAALSMSFRA